MSDERIARLRRELAEEEAFLKVKEAVKAALGLDDKAFPPGSRHVYRADCHISLEAENLPEALEIAEKMNPETMARVKGTFLTFCAAEKVTQKEEDECEVETITPYVYKLDKTRGYPVGRNLVFYVKAGGCLVEVRVAVKNDLDTNIIFECKYDQRGNPQRIRDDLVNKSGYFPKVDQFWSPQGSPRSRVLWSY